MPQEAVTEPQSLRSPLTRDAAEVPRPPRRPSQRTVHGDVVISEYSWLRETGSAEVAAYLEAENSYADAAISHLGGLRTSLLRELTAPPAPTELLLPVRHGGWWYLDRPQILAGHGLDASLSRVADGPDLPRGPGGVPVLEAGQPLPGEQMLVEDRRTVFGVAHSGEHGLLARAEEAEEPHRSCAVAIIDLATGMVIDRSVRSAGPDLAFAADGAWLLYAQADEHGRRHQVRRHRIGAPAQDDPVVLDETDRWAEVTLTPSRDGSTLMIHSRSPLSTQAWSLDLTDPGSAPRSVTGRREHAGLIVEHAGDRFLTIAENESGRSVLSEIPLAGAAPQRPVMVGREGEQFDGVEAFADFVALQVRSDGLPGVRIIPRRRDGTLATLAVWTLGAGGELDAVRLDANPEWTQDVVRYRTDSLLTPTTLAHADVATGEVTELRRAHSPGFDPERYVEKRLWAQAPDGARIPISLISRRDVRADGTAAGVLYGYGAFGLSVDPMLAREAVPLLDRGLVVAIAHVRGGGEMGRTWHDRGRLLEKGTSFEDFVTCAEHLVETGWVHAQRLAAAGDGAGGLLVAGAANLAPERFRAVLAIDPLVDPLGTFLDPEAMLTLPEWAEWGDPVEDESVYHAMQAYSPAENVRDVPYPAVFAQAACEGHGAPCTEAAVWVARLRGRVSSESAERPVLLRCISLARIGAVERRAETMAWVLDQLGAAGSA